MFRTVHLSIIRSLFTVHSAMVYVIQVCRQLSSRSICSSSKAVYKSVCHISLLSVQWINSWWWTDELSETCRVSCQNKFVKLVHLVGFIITKLIHEVDFSVKSVAQLNTKACHVTLSRYETHTQITNSESPTGFPETWEGHVNFWWEAKWLKQWSCNSSHFLAFYISHNRLPCARRIWLSLFWAKYAQITGRSSSNTAANPNLFTTVVRIAS